MRKLLIALLFPVCQLQAQELSYYLPKDIQYNPAVPTPEKVIGHHVGEWHITHDRLVQYMRAIDQASDRVSLTDIGLTYEGRPQVVLTVTSPANHAPPRERTSKTCWTRWSSCWIHRSTRTACSAFPPG
jgi:hypothetical protein